MQGINLSVSDAEQPDAAVAATIPTNSFVFKILLQFFKLNTYLDGNIPNSYFSVTVRIITWYLEVRFLNSNTEKATVKQVDPEPRSYNHREKTLRRNRKHIQITGLPDCNKTCLKQMTEAQTVPKTVNCTADAETAYSAAMHLSVSDAATISTNSFLLEILLQFFKLNTYLDGNIPNSYFSVTVRIITHNTVNRQQLITKAPQVGSRFPPIIRKDGCTLETTQREPTAVN